MGILSVDRWKEMDWDNDGCITFKVRARELARLGKVLRRSLE